MQDGSFFSLIILLVLFLVLPAVMKKLGRYTLESKEADREEREGDTPGYEKREDLEGLPPGKHDQGPMEKPHISNKPITPKWFG
jgi:hypothetical protein